MSMSVDFEHKNDEKASLVMHPKKFALWLFIVSIVMIFASLTSAYIVRQGEGNWRVFDLPPMFLYSSIVLLASSGTMQWALRSAKHDDFGSVKTGIGATLVLGIAFLFMQLKGWSDLVHMKVFFAGGNPSESFLYVLTGLHGFHLVTGLVFVIIVLISAFRKDIHAKRLVPLEMCATYWHFLDGLWLYLYLFLMFNR